MRKVAVFLAVLLASPLLFAVKPQKPEPSLDESLTYINKTLYPRMDYFHGCSEKVEVTLSEQHQEIIVTHLPVDGGGKVKQDLPPIYVYRIPVADVKLIYPYGFSPYVRYDRIIIRTNGKAISKYGPYYDCFHRKISSKTRLRLVDQAMLKIDDLTDSQLMKLINAFKRTVELTRIEAAQADQNPSNAAADQKFENEDDDLDF